MHVLGLMHLRSFCSIWVVTALSLGKCCEGGGVWGESSRWSLLFFFLFMFFCFASSKAFHHNNTSYTHLHLSLFEQIAHPFLHLTYIDGCTTPANEWGRE